MFLQSLIKHTCAIPSTRWVLICVIATFCYSNWKARRHWGQFRMLCWPLLLQRQKVVSTHIDIMFDVYKDVFIKNAEWQRWWNSVEAIVYKTLFPNQVVQQWDSFKASPVNKANLIRFITSECVEPNWESSTLLCWGPLYIGRRFYSQKVQ